MTQEEMPVVVEGGHVMPMMNENDMTAEPAIPMERDADVMPADGGPHMMGIAEGDEMMDGMMGGRGHHGHVHHGHGHHAGGGFLEKGMGVGGWMHHP